MAHTRSKKCLVKPVPVLMLNDYQFDSQEQPCVTHEFTVNSEPHAQREQISS